MVRERKSNHVCTIAHWCVTLSGLFMYIKVKVTPGSRKEMVFKENDTMYRISVREPAARNLANKKVASILSQIFGEAVDRVTLVAGHRSPNKIYDISLRS